MNKSIDFINGKRLEKVKEALIKNNMNAYIAHDSKEACEIAKSLMKEGALVGSGGSQTLIDCGMMDVLRSGKYEYLDREGASDVDEIFRKAFYADYYISSSNAVTENGELYNVDGNSNRVACICYGPKSVIVIVGRNKIVHSIDDAIKRVKKVAAPANCTRLGVDSYCAHAGECKGVNGSMADGCAGARICCSYVVTSFQRKKGRINVILVDEELGF